MGAVLPYHTENCSAYRDESWSISSLGVIYWHNLNQWKRRLISVSCSACLIGPFREPVFQTAHSWICLRYCPSCSPSLTKVKCSLRTWDQHLWLVSWSELLGFKNWHEPEIGLCCSFSSCVPAACLTVVSALPKSGQQTSTDLDVQTLMEEKACGRSRAPTRGQRRLQHFWLFLIFKDYPKNS